MSPEEAFVQWREGLGARPNWGHHWARLAEALGRLVVRNSHDMHGRVVLARLNDLDRIVSDLRVALCGYDEETGPRNGGEEHLGQRTTADRFWSHLKPEIALLKGSFSDHFRAIDGPLLAQTIERYHRSPWLANDLLDWIMLDAAVYRDVVSFGETIKRDVEGLAQALSTVEFGRETRRIALRAVGVCGELSAFVAAPLAVAMLAPRYVTGRIVLWIVPAAAACVAVYALVALVRMLRRNRGKERIRKALARWSAMAAAYGSLAGPLIAVDQVRHALEEAADRGAIWSREIETLLEHASARGVQAWRL